MSLEVLENRLIELAPGHLCGRIVEVSIAKLLANGPLCSVGDICAIIDHTDLEICRAEAIHIRPGHVVLLPLEHSEEILPGFRVVLVSKSGMASVGDAYRGRLIDALGEPLDEQGPIIPSDHRALVGEIPKPLARATQNHFVETGIKAFDTLIPIAKGQRVGVFSAAGVGKTTLLTQLARQMDCDHCVLCLVGERGREVAAMWSSIRAGETTAELSAVISTSDQAATSRIRAVNQAVCMSEYWRDKGQHVLLIVDSVTRYAMALREVGLASGGTPTMRAYTPNVFAALPRMVERCGSLKNGGAITGIFSILSETDEIDDPIVEAMKSYLDGHIILSRELAEKGHFPAIDVPASLSRLTPELLSDAELDLSHTVIELLSTYRKSRLLIESGLYSAGTDTKIDRAILLKPEIEHYLQQKSTERYSVHQSHENLAALLGGEHV